MGLIKSSVIPTLQVGGRVLTDLTNLKVLFASIQTASRFSCLKNQDGTTYVVPVGKTFKVVAVRTVSGSTSAAVLWQLLYGDTDVGINGASAPTNAVYQAGSSSVYGGFSLQGAAATPNTAMLECDTDFRVPTGKYPTWTCNITNTGAMIYGYEV